MAYTNSPLVSYTLLSPNHSGQRNHSIDRITPHCVVGQCSVEALGQVFLPSSRQASSNYGIGPDGRIGMYVEEKNRSWCSSSRENDHRAVTIECASDNSFPYAMKEPVFDSLVTLCADICSRNGKKRLMWFGEKNAALNYTPKADDMILTVHRWFSNTECPGAWLLSRMDELAKRVTEALADGSGNQSGTLDGTTQPDCPPAAMQASELLNLSTEEVITKLGPLFTADSKRSGILASVSFAQFILESGYGKSELAQKANNCFGMKASLSGNSWAGSAWDGESTYPR